MILHNVAADTYTTETQPLSVCLALSMILVMRLCLCACGVCVCGVWGRFSRNVRRNRALCCVLGIGFRSFWIPIIGRCSPTFACCSKAVVLSYHYNMRFGNVLCRNDNKRNLVIPSTVVIVPVLFVMTQNSFSLLLFHTTLVVHLKCFCTTSASNISADTFTTNNRNMAVIRSV